MSNPHDASSTNARIQAYRDRLRVKGLRPVQVWLPDVRSKEFAGQAHLQSFAVRGWVKLSVNFPTKTKPGWHGR